MQGGVSDKIVQFGFNHLGFIPCWDDDAEERKIFVLTRLGEEMEPSSIDDSDTNGLPKEEPLQTSHLTVLQGKETFNHRLLRNGLERHNDKHTVQNRGDGALLK